MSNHDPYPIPPLTRDVWTRFIAKVDRDTSTGCWNWRSTPTTGGYGRFTILARPYRAHRVIYAWTYGDTTAEIRHTCENPRCVNPEHLKTEGEQQHRHRDPRYTHCKNGHELTEENTHLDGRGARQCRICSRERMRRYRERHHEMLRAIERARRKPIVHDPRFCKACGEDFVPIRSTAWICLECRSKPNPIRREYMREYMRARRHPVVDSSNG